MKTAPSQSGAAVIIAMLIVAVAGTVATLMLQQNAVSVRQLELSRDYDQARWILAGGAHWARAILAADAGSSSLDHDREIWASGLPITEVGVGQLSGTIRDQQGLFNLTNLIREGKPSTHDFAVLGRLLQATGLRVDLANALADWIDADSEVRADGGAEDDHYLSLPAPYRAANLPLGEIGEIGRVRGFDAAAVSRLGQVATALPRRTPVNVNTAPPEVLFAIVDGLTLSEARLLAHSRTSGPFRDAADFLSRLPRRKLQVEPSDISVQSQFFLVEGRAQVGRARVGMQALLQRDGVALPLIVWKRRS